MTFEKGMSHYDTYIRAAHTAAAHAHPQNRTYTFIKSRVQYLHKAPITV